MSVSRRCLGEGRIDRNLQRIVANTIEAHGMLAAGDAVLVGVSGGADSMALLHLLVGLAPGWRLRLGIAHLNHGLRGKESDGDAAFVASVAKNLDLPYHTQKTDVRSYQKRRRLSLEEAARSIRYGFFHAVAQAHGYSRIALGHHGDDNAELVLMHILRGSGPRGISGIPPVRGEKIVRPLISLKKSDILQYLAEKEAGYVSDGSNEDTRFLRNRIRHELIPSLSASYNPNIVDTLTRMASITRTEEEWIEEVLDPIFERAVVEARADRIVLSAQCVQECHPAAKRRVLRRAIAQVKRDLRRIGFTHIESAVHLVGAYPGHGRLDLPDGIRIYLEGGHLVVAAEPGGLPEPGSDPRGSMIPDFEYRLAKPGSLWIKEANVRISIQEAACDSLPHGLGGGNQACYVDVGKAHFPLTVRNVRAGDRFSPLGMTGTQKVSRFFMNRKIPRRERARYPILTNSKGSIIWVGGGRIDEGFRVLPSSRDILKIELFLA